MICDIPNLFPNFATHYIYSIMKNLKLILVLLTICWLGFVIPTSAQVLCIYCYDQNDSISHGVNNLIQNGGFENGCNSPGRFCPNASLHTCDITDWTCTGGGIHTYAQIFDISANVSVIVEGTKVVYFGNAFCNACSTTACDTSCLSNLNCTVIGIPIGYPVHHDSGYGGDTGVSIKQTVSGLIVGNTYVLEFWAGGENNANGKGLFAIDVGFGDTLLRDKPTPPITGIGTRFIIEFRATSTSHTIKFTNWGHICGGFTELILDDVRLYTLAELNPAFPHCTTTGINELTASPTPSLFPTPTTNAVNITTNNQSPSEVILYDITGRKLLHQPFSGSTSLNIETLAKGIYLYQIKDKDGVLKNGKIAVE